MRKIMIDGEIVKKEINGEIKWVYEEQHYDGFAGFLYVSEFPFDTYYDAEHCARLRSKNEKYKSSFTRTYDQYGKETFREDNVVFKIITPDSEDYWYNFNYNRSVDIAMAKYNKSFWRKLFKFFFKPDGDKLELPQTKVEMIVNPNKIITIFEGKDWGEAEHYIREFVKKKSLYWVKDGNTSSD